MFTAPEPSTRSRPLLAFRWLRAHAVSFQRLRSNPSKGTRTPGAYDGMCPPVQCALCNTEPDIRVFPPAASQLCASDDVHSRPRGQRSHESVHPDYSCDASLINLSPRPAVTTGRSAAGSASFSLAHCLPTAASRLPSGRTPTLKGLLARSCSVDPLLGDGAVAAPSLPHRRCPLANPLNVRPFGFQHMNDGEGPSLPCSRVVGTLQSFRAVEPLLNRTVYLGRKLPLERGVHASQVRRIRLPGAHLLVRML